MGYLLAAISGLLLFLAYPPYNLSYLAFIALIPLLISLKGSLFKMASLGYLFGLVFFGGLLFWMNSMRLYGVACWARPLLWLLLVVSLSLYPAIFGLLYGLVSKRLQGLFALLAACIIWCGLEFIRTHFPLGGFPWALLGYSQYLNLPLIQIVSFTGVYGVSFLVILFNAIIIEICGPSTLKRKVLLFTLCLLLYTSCYAYGWWSLSQPLPPKDLKVAAVQGNFDIEMSWNWRDTHGEFRSRLSELTGMALPVLPELIVWTETIILDPLSYLPGLARELALLTEGSASLLLGAPHYESKGTKTHYFNSAFLLLPEGRIAQRYDKLHLVPFGERLPGERFIPWLRDLFPMAGDYTPGSNFTLFRIGEKGSFGVLICFEDIFAGLARRFVRDGAAFMVNITNDAWSRSRGCHYQHFQASIFRAVENRCYILRAGNTGVSAIIDPYGRIERIIPINTAGIITGEVSTLRPHSLYTRWGDLFVYLCLGAGVFMVFFVIFFLPSLPKCGNLTVESRESKKRR